MRIVLSPDAAASLTSITNPLRADIIQKLKVLGTYPMIGTAMTGRFFRYRSFTVDFFRIIYRIRNNEIIEVAYIRDCRRKPL